MYYKGGALCQQSIVCILVDIQLDQWHTHHTMHLCSPHLVSSYSWDLFLVILVYNSYKIAGLLQNIVSKMFDFFCFFFNFLKKFFEWAAHFLNKNAEKMQIIRSRSPKRIWRCIHECISGPNKLNVSEKEKKNGLQFILEKKNLVSRQFTCTCSKIIPVFMKNDAHILVLSLITARKSFAFVSWFMKKASHILVLWFSG